MPKAEGKLRVQMDELWSFVDDRGNKQWVWLAMGCRDPWDYWVSRRRSLSGFCYRAMAIYPSRIPAVRQGLHRPLRSLQDGDIQQAPLRSGQRQRTNELHRAIGQHDQTAHIAVSKKDAVILEKTKESHWRDMAARSRVQLQDSEYVE